MKTRLIVLLASLVSAIVFSNCKKDNQDPMPSPPPPPAEMRLKEINYKAPAGDVNHTKLEYNSSGKVTRITNQLGTNAAATTFDIIYSGNQITLASLAVDSVNRPYADTIRLTVDNDGKVLKRIRYTFYLYPGTGQAFQRQFIYDTLQFEYDAIGLLTKEIHGSCDSTWKNPYSPSSDVHRESIVSNFTIVNNNATVKKGNGFITTVHYSGSNKTSNVDSAEVITNFDYTHAYTNKTDFSNAAILDEIDRFSYLPVNKSYANLPEKVDYKLTQKSLNGTTLSATYSTYNFQFNYNSDGYLSNRIYMGDSGNPVNYVYSLSN